MRNLLIMIFASLLSMQAKAQETIRTEETKAAGYTYITYEVWTGGAGNLGNQLGNTNINCHHIILHGEMNATDMWWLRTHLKNAGTSGATSSVNAFELRLCIDLADVDFKAGDSGQTSSDGRKIKADEDDMVPEASFHATGNTGDFFPAIAMVIFPERAKKIGDWVCGKTNSFAYAVIGSETEEIGEHAFDGCLNLRGIFIPKDNKLKTIKSSFLAQVSNNPTTVNLPSGLQSIGSGIISDNSKMSSVFVHCSGLAISDGAVSKKISNAYFYGDVAPSFAGGNALKFESNANIFVPVGSKDDYAEVLNTKSQVYGSTTFGTTDGKVNAATVLKEAAITIPVTGSEAYRTWSDVSARTLPLGVKTYIVDNIISNQVSLSEVTGAIPADGSILAADDVTSVSRDYIYGGKELTILVGMDTDNRSGTSEVPLQCDYQALNEAATAALKASVHEVNGSRYFVAQTTGTTPVGADGTNYLLGSGESTLTISGFDTDAGYYNYVLGNQNDQLAFCKANSGQLGAHKAYLHIPTSMLNAEAHELRIVFGAEEVTGISNATLEVKNSECYYDLQGRRVTNPSKGLFIRCGKKVIIK